MSEKTTKSIYALARAFDKPWIPNPDGEDIVDELCDQFRHILCATENVLREPKNGEYIAHLRRCTDRGWKMFQHFDQEKK